jgi:tyrosinase
VIPRDPGDCNELDCLCPFFLGELLQNGSCLLNNSEILKPAVRKEYRLLTEDERKRFHSAMIELKTSGEFDIFAKMHSNETVIYLAHGGPAFLPWHREYLKRY